MKLFARAVTAALLTTIITAGSAHADATTNTPPVTQDDAVTMRADDVAEVGVLANDTDPDGDALAICRLGDVPSQLDVEIMDDTTLAVLSGRAGTYTFTYYACDFTTLVPATVTVTVKPAPRLRVHVSKSATRPGMLHVFNRSGFGARFMWGSYKANKEDGSVYLRAHTGRWVHVRRHSLMWVALNEHRAALRIGFVRGIRLPASVHALPAGAPPASGGSFSFTMAGRPAHGWVARALQR